MSEGNHLPAFPVDDVTLDLLWDALHPGPEADRTSLLVTLSMFDRLGGSDPDAIAQEIAPDVVVMRDESYHPNDVIAALITEVRRLRGDAITAAL